MSEMMMYIINIEIESTLNAQSTPKVIPKNHYEIYKNPQYGQGNARGAWSKN